MTRRVLTGLLAFAAVVGFTVVPGCSQRLGDLTIATNKNIEVGSYNPDTMEPQQITGKDCKPVFLFIPTGQPNIEAALDDAFARSGTNLMTDAVLTRRWWTALIFTQHCMEASGNGWSVDIASLTTEQLEQFANAEGGSYIRAEVDGEQQVGRILGATSQRLAVRTDAGDVRWIDLDAVSRLLSSAPLADQ